MSRHKLKKFAQLESFPNYYDNTDVRDPKNLVFMGQKVAIKGKWSSDYFKNDNPITLELACGRGEYAVALGRMFPDRNFIGVDIKGARIHQGATTALNEGLTNVAFLRTRIEMIEHFFAKDEVDEIWITFPDPFLRDADADKRLTAAPFLQRYRHFLQPDGVVHLKTDSPDLYDFTLEICKNTETKATQILSRRSEPLEETRQHRLAGDAREAQEFRRERIAPQTGGVRELARVTPQTVHEGQCLFQRQEFVVGKGHLMRQGRGQTFAPVQPMQPAPEDRAARVRGERLLCELNGDCLAVAFELQCPGHRWVIRAWARRLRCFHRPPVNPQSVAPFHLHGFG